MKGEPGEKPQGKPMRYSIQDLISPREIGKGCTITMSNGRSESGTLTQVSMFEIELKLSNGRHLIVMKHSLVTVSFT